MSGEDFLHKANLRFYDNVIIDCQNAKKELEEVKKPLLKALYQVNSQIERINKTIDKYVQKKETEENYLTYSETSSTSSS